MFPKLQAFKSTYGKILPFVVLPLLVVLITLSASVIYNFSSSKEQIRANSSSMLQLFFQSCEKEINHILQSAAFFEENQTVFDALKNKTDWKNSDIISNVQHTLSGFMDIYPLVDNVTILNQETGLVLTDNGSFSAKNYFEKIYAYSNYSSSYWQRYRFLDSSDYRILSPSFVDTANGRKAILPIVFRNVKSSRFGNLLIINLSLDRLIVFDNAYKQTPNTKVYLLSNYSGQVFGNNVDETSSNILQTPLYEKLLSGVQSFDGNFQQSGNAFILTNQIFETLTGYTYFAVIPYADIYQLQYGNLLFTIIILLLMIIESVLLAMYSTKKIMAPIKQVSHTLNYKTETEGTDIFTHIQSSVDELHRQNEELTIALPFAQEKYLINFLNSAESSIDETAREILKNSLPFSKECFACVIFRLYPKNLFYNEFQDVDSNAIRSLLLETIKQYFLETFTAFFLSSEQDALYIILNVNQPTEQESIAQTVREVCRLLEYDNSYLSVYLGRSSVYRGLDGLRQAYSEAMTSLQLVTQNFTVSGNDKQDMPDLREDIENQIYNALIAYDTNTARTLIADVTSNIVDSRTLKHIYTQILIIIFKVLHVKNIPYENEKYDFEIYAEIIKQTNADINMNILLLLDQIEAHGSSDQNNKENAVIAYIGQHYCDQNISLKSLSELFHVTPGYLSLLIKNSIGIGFHEHLTNLRIAKIKALLVETNCPIDEIYETSGFNSKQTFFRVFKNAVGSTPSEYRQDQRQ